MYEINTVLRVDSTGRLWIRWGCKSHDVTFEYLADTEGMLKVFMAALTHQSEHTTK